MHEFEYVHPTFPNAKPFAFAIDLACIDSVMNNGNEFILDTNTGKTHRVLAKMKFDNLVNLIKEAKEKRHGSSYNP